MRLTLHLIHDILDIENVLALYFDDRTIMDHHAHETWSFPNTRICVRTAKIQSQVICLYPGIASVGNNIADIYTAKAIFDHQSLMECDAQKLSNRLFQEYCRARDNIFTSRNYIKEFVDNLKFD